PPTPQASSPHRFVGAPGRTQRSIDLGKAELELGCRGALCPLSGTLHPGSEAAVRLRPAGGGAGGARTPRPLLAKQTPPSGVLSSKDAGRRCAGPDELGCRDACFPRLPSWSNRIRGRQMLILGARILTQESSPVATGHASAFPLSNDVDVDPCRLLNQAVD